MKKNSMLLFMAVVYSTLQWASGQTHTEVVEHVLYENIKQGPRSVAYYQYKIQNDNYYGEEHLTFKVMADSFDSDPDIYISRSKANLYPSSSENADWYCERKGSETCVIQKGDFAIGQTLYIGITCTRACSYKLRIWFTATVDLTTSNRRQLRFDAYSTYILKYVVPEKVLEEDTKSIEIYVQPEHPYTAIDLFLSLDASFYLIEETPAAHISKTGKAIKFTDRDYKWCRNCAVYGILNVYAEDRYYITSLGRVQNDELSDVIPADIFVNAFEQQCYAYFVQRTKWDARLDIESYAGHADAYITAKTRPSGPDSETIDLRAAHGTDVGVALSVAARKELGQTAGTYYLCFYAYTPFSARISVTEADLAAHFVAIDGQVLTAYLPAGSWLTSRYGNTAFTGDGVIRVWVEAQALAPDQEPPQVWYAACKNSDPDACIVDESRVLSAGRLCLLGRDDSEGDCGATQVEITRGSGSTFLIPHQPWRCVDPSSCYYVFVVQSADGVSRGVSIMVSAEFEDPGDVLLRKTYKNVIKNGQFVPHEINPTANADIQPYINKLKITVESRIGDADLFVSQTERNPNNDNSQWKSRLTEPIDEVILVSGGDTVDFTRSIYFTVYGNTYSEVIITFEYTFAPSYDEQLDKAIPIGDGAYEYTNIPDEYGERLYSFSPWWSGKENRTMVFLADVLINKVFFYSRWNAYPKHFYTSQHDFNDTIAIYGNDIDNHHNGTYYIRLRPDFALYDLLSARQYIYNMFTFSQTPATWEGKELGYENIELGETYVGFANQSRYQDYRYMQIDMRATYTITVKRIPGLGTPQFYVSLVDHGYLNSLGQPDDGDAPRKDSAAFRGAPTPGKTASRSHLVLTEFQRSGRGPRCATVRHSAQGTDQQACFIAISVRCLGIKQCAYQLKIDRDDINWSTKQYSNRAEGQAFTPYPPGTILASDYINGRIGTKNEVKYYYFPIDYKRMRDAMILLHKTQIFGSGENGDSKLLVNIISGVEDSTTGQDQYQSWNYPSDLFREAESSSGPGNAEIVEVCQEKLAEKCEGAQGCALLVGVVGKSDTLASYRLKGFYGRNKLYLDTPRRLNSTEERTDRNKFDYYWFVISESAVTAGADFQYQVSVATDGTGDPDLYVSLMDGRFPTEEDYDLVSDQIGADSIRISSNQTLWDERGWDPRAGVVVVVGVRVKGPMNYTIALTTPASEPTSPLLTMERVFAGQAQKRVNLTAEQSDGYSQIYQFYNWYHRNFEITFNFLEGERNATIMYQKAGQMYENNNIYTGVPLTVNNSFNAFNVSQGKYRIIEVNGSNCYSCWYFIRIDIKDTVATRYEFSIAQAVDSSGQYVDLDVGRQSTITVRGLSFQKRKFVLDSMDNWVLQAIVATGDVEVYVGSNPDTVDKGGHIWASSTSTGRDIRIAVKTTDVNFHLATYYYIYIVSTSSTDSRIKLTLTQERTVDFVGNNHDYTYTLTRPLFQDWTMRQKFFFKTVEEQVKFHVFRVPPPTSSTAHHKVAITIDPLTPNFYPKIYLNKIQSTTEITNLGTLKYPNLVDHDLAFGENPFYQLNSEKFVYTFTENAENEFVYYTMAIYQHTWGLTTYKKSAYQIGVVSDQTHVTVTSTRPEITASSDALFVQG